MNLDAYRKKRDTARTPEPAGSEQKGTGATREGAYVVHQHDARRMHWDLRMEYGGVLSSFAVPRGPTLSPKERRLAVRTEDHPLEYLDFEDVIPEGNYGAGPMIAWDKGLVRYLDGSAEEGLAAGKLEFELQGLKLHGRFLLVRMKGDEGKAWLLFKKHDAWADEARDIVAEAPRSVLSGLTIDELSRASGIAEDIEAEAAKLGAPPGEVPRDMVPMPCAPGTEVPREASYSYELKLDGVRAIARKSGREVALVNRKLRDVTPVYPEIARAVAALAAGRAVLDGEIVALDEAGQPSFQRLAGRIHRIRAHDVRRAMLGTPVLYVAFDLLAIGGRDLRSLPLSTRKALLRRLLPAPGTLRVLDALEGDPERLLAFCHDRHLEGIVAKRVDAPYRPGPGRSTDWLKLKCARDEELVVVGYTLGEGARARLGALDVASHEGGALVYRGKVGSGIDVAAVEDLRARLDPLKTKEKTAEGDYHPAPGGRVHVRPEAVVSVRFAGFTDDGSLRFPVYRGVREDVAPEECTAAPHGDRDEAEIERLSAEVVESGGARAKAPPRVTLSHPDKVLWPEDGITKRDLAAYHEAIAPVLLPHLQCRPVMLVRYPDGILGRSFYQWNVPPGLPSWVSTLRVDIKGREGVMEVFHLRDVETLRYVVNMAAIPIHALASRKGSIDECDFSTLDLDVSAGAFAQAITLARALRRLLDDIGLPGFPKTSGQSGLHVLVPLGPGISFETARTLADLLGHLLVQRHPDIATMERMKKSRGPRVYVDTGQTGASRTIVAPYSPRAWRGATVSTPLDWDEVNDELDPARFDLRTVPARVAERGDPMAGLLAARPSVAGVMERLAKLVGGGRRAA